MDLSIIILAFRNSEKLRQTLRAVFASDIKVQFEVIVVDNDSGDGTPEMVEKEFSQVRVIRNANNGFSKGNNLGIKQAKGVTVLLLNPDTEVRPDAIQLCYDFLNSHADVGIVGCKLIKTDG